MKRYETYKDSGIQWVGEIPSHWDSNKLKFFADISTGTTPSTANEEYWNEATENWYTPADFNEGDIHLNGSSRKVSAMAFEKSACKVFKKNVVLVVGIGATLGKIGFSRVECSANQQINAIEFYDNVYPLFGAYYLSSLKEVMKSLASAATLAIMNQSVTGSIPFVCPTLTEQETIAAYLDRKVSQIDATIAEKEQMLEDLKNYRSAIISEAVTKGLDKNVEMKDSGIEWLGMIPKHWGLVKLKNKAKVNGRIGFRGYTIADLVPKGQGAYTIGGKHITNCVIDLSNPDFISWDKYYESPEIMVKKGDILMAQRGSLGKAALAREDIGDATINPSLVLLNSILMNEVFLYYYLVSSSCLAYIDLLNTATAVPMISQNQIENIFVPIPSGKEQKQISDYLDRKTKEIDETTIMVSTQISDLKSYKSALITEAVTGKIDLRDWKPKKVND